MSLLAPLYVIGAFAIGAPILFHLIRRQPKGQVPFSSLMFLKPTPPRLTRRSRLDNWLLLLLRADPNGPPLGVGDINIFVCNIGDCGRLAWAARRVGFDVDAFACVGHIDASERNVAHAVCRVARRY